MTLLRDAFGGWTRWNAWNWRGFRDLGNNPAIKIGGGGSWRACLGLGSCQVGDGPRCVPRPKSPAGIALLQVSSPRPRICGAGGGQQRGDGMFRTDPGSLASLSLASFLCYCPPVFLFPCTVFFLPRRAARYLCRCLLRLTLGRRPAAYGDTAPNAIKCTASLMTVSK